MAKQTVNIGSTANDGTGDQLRTAFDKLNQNNDEIYGDNFVTEDMLNDDIVGTDKLKVTGNGTAGQILTSDGDGTFSWSTGVAGDITAVNAGDGLTGDATSGDVTLNVVGGAGITASADEISLSTSVAGDGLTFTTGVLSVDTIQTGDIADDAITSPKLAEFDDTFTAGTSGDIIVSNGTDFIHTTMSGDATIVSGGAITIANDAIDATKLNVADNGTSGQLLKSDGDGSFSWVTALTGDVEAIVAGAGLTGTDLDGPTPTLNVIAGDGISVTADAVSLDPAVAGDGLTFTSGVLSVDDLDASNIADDAITPSQINIFNDASVATDTHILIADGTSFSNYVMSGDATLANDGTITIADDAIDADKILNDAVTADKLADSINADIATGVAKVDFPGFGNTAGTALEGDTALLQLGTSSTTALAGDTALLQLGTSSTTALAGDTDLLVLGNTGTTALAGNTTTITAQQISDITGNNSKLTNADHTGEVTGSGALTITDGAVVADRLAADAVTTVKILDANVTTGKLADDSVTNAKLGVEYTASIALTSDTDVAVDTSLGDVFTMTAGHSHTFNFTNVVIGDVKTLEITGSGGSYTSAFGTVNGSSCTFNKIGGAYSDTAAKQLIQIKWTATNAAWYQISPIAS